MKSGQLGCPVCFGTGSVLVSGSLAVDGGRPCPRCAAPGEDLLVVGGRAAQEIPLPSGRILRDEGIASILRHQRLAWTEGVFRAMETFRGGSFTIEDLRGACIRQGVGLPKHPNAWGAVFAAACRAKRIRPLDKTTSARRPEARARRIREWEVIQ